MKSFVAAAFAFSLVAAYSQLKLVPTPQQVTLGQGTFRFTRSTAIALGSPSDPDDRFAAEQLVDELKTDAHIQPRIRPSGHVLIGRMGRDKAVDDAVAALGLSLPPDKRQEGYVLCVAPDKILVAAPESAGVFYGIQTLKQLVRANSSKGEIPCCTVADWPALRYRAWQDDISRGPIPTLDFLKREVRTMAEYKSNAFTMYTEHVFKLKKHPTIAPKDGITAEEVKELSAYGKRYHVEVIGNFQSFGHFANILKVPGYEGLGEAGWLISPAKPESYKFLGDVYSEIAPAYDSPLFDINCDEVGGLGTGASKEMVEKEGVAAVYAGHIAHLAELLKPYGKTPMMWGDIALQNRDIVPRLPKDLIVLSWGYDPRADFDGAIKPFTEIGFRFMVCPGVSCWSQIYPDLDAATVNISNYIRDGARNGALGVLNTTWDDSGENLFNANWLPLLWGAECSWNPAVPKEGEDRDELRDQRLAAFNRAFASVFFGSPEDQATQALWDLSRLRKNPVTGGMMDWSFWRDLKSAATSGGSVSDAIEAVRASQQLTDALRRAKPAAVYNRDTLDYAMFSARRAGFSGDRVMAAKVMAAGATDDAARQRVKSALAGLASDALALRDEYARLWRAEERPWWLDQNLAKWDALVGQLKTGPITPVISPETTSFRGSVDVQIRVLEPGGEIRYTLDGGEPTSQSPHYEGPVQLTKTTRVRARHFRSDGSTGPVTEVTYRTTSLLAVVTPPLPQHEDHAPMLGFDGDEDSYYWSEGPPVTGQTFTITLDTPGVYESVKAITGHPDHSADIAHNAVLEVSSDGSSWVTVATFADGLANADLHRRVVKAVRIRLTADNGNWLVVREVELR